MHEKEIGKKMQFHANFHFIYMMYIFKPKNTYLVICIVLKYV
jgi:hypothetical protein